MFFAEKKKNVSGICIAKATHIFVPKLSIFVQACLSQYMGLLWNCNVYI